MRSTPRFGEREVHASLATSDNWCYVGETLSDIMPNYRMRRVKTDEASIRTRASAPQMISGDDSTFCERVGGVWNRSCCSRRRSRVKGSRSHDKERREPKAAAAKMERDDRRELAQALTDVHVR